MIVHSCNCEYCTEDVDLAKLVRMRPAGWAIQNPIFDHATTLRIYHRTEETTYVVRAKGLEIEIRPDGGASTFLAAEDLLWLWHVQAAVDKFGAPQVLAAFKS